MSEIDKLFPFPLASLVHSITILPHLQASTSWLGEDIGEDMRDKRTEGSEKR